MAVVTEAKIKVAINGFGRIGACAMRSRMITLSHVDDARCAFVRVWVTTTGAFERANVMGE